MTIVALLVDAARGRFEEPFEFTDFLAHTPRAFTLMGAQSVTSLAGLLHQGTGSVQQIWARLQTDAEELASRVPEQRRAFVNGHLVTQVAIHRHSNSLLHHSCGAVLSLGRGDRVTALGELRRAREAALDLLRTLVRGENGRWGEWYRGDVFVDAPATLRLLDELHDAVADGPWPVPDGAGFVLPSAQYDRIKAYQVGRQAGPARLVRPADERSAS